ncbi:hypothetical protein [Actinokineospora sp.]|uniref:hypothetical protein n=1 Tax=Actinokineospora sp. TaxID=1872133 RepID=UPI004037B59F
MVSGFEVAKDTIQEVTESAATHAGRIALILTGAVRDVAREVGEWATDVIELREAAARAAADHSADHSADRDTVVDEKP